MLLRDLASVDDPALPTYAVSPGGARRRGARTLGALLLAAVMLSAPVDAAADAAPDLDLDPPPPETQPRHLRIALFESAIALVIPSVYYWSTREAAEIDYDLQWDWDSWKAKLSFDAVRFDTNSWTLNAVRHPLMSVIQYEIGRTNGLGMFGSMLLATAHGVVWEFLVEYREYPSLNDLVVNAVTGLQIAEPLWQLGQLWRGGDLSPGDRVKTALVSPFDAMHDLVGRRHRRWFRPRAWRSIDLFAGGLRRQLGDDRTHDEAVLAGDVDLVNDARYLAPGPQRGPIRPGTWSRIRGAIRIGDVGGGTELLAVQLRSRTTLAGRHGHDERGYGLAAALGTGFTYRRDRLADTFDHVAIAHLVGPQLQLSRRTPGLAVRWDAAGYGDFAMIDAHVFGGAPPFTPPPPYVSLLQAPGYYTALGVTGSTRVRLDTGAWSLEGELDAHKAWQIDGLDRVQQDELPTGALYTAYGVSDLRLYWRAQLGFRRGALGLAVAADGAHRRGAWAGLRRDSSEVAIGLLGQLAL